VELEIVAQSLIKNLIFTSEASPCFIVLVIVKINSSGIKVHALLDFGASACFMDKDFVDRHKVPLVIRKYPILVEVIDSKPLVSRDLLGFTHETTA
jgi:hypothetical protein